MIWAAKVQRPLLLFGGNQKFLAIFELINHPFKKPPASSKNVQRQLRRLNLYAKTIETFLALANFDALTSRQITQTN